MTDTTCPKNSGGEHFFKKGAFADSPIRCTYCSALMCTAVEAAPLVTPAKRLLTARAAAPRILDIHLDDCEDDRCEGCEPRHLAQKSATGRTARQELLLLDASGEWPAYVDRILTKHRAEVERELLGDEQNPSPLLLNATAYRLLVERIEATMTAPDQWDGDDAEVEIISRYVEWLAAGSPVEDGWPVRVEASESRGIRRIEVLSEVADLLMQADETAAALLVDRMREGGAR